MFNILMSMGTMTRQICNYVDDQTFNMAIREYAGTKDEMLKKLKDECNLSYHGKYGNAHKFVKSFN